MANRIFRNGSTGLAIWLSTILFPNLVLASEPTASKLPSVLVAQTSSLSLGNSSFLKLSERFLKHDKKSFTGNFGLKGTHFLTEKRSDVESENYSYLNGNLLLKDKKGDFDWSAEMVFELSSEIQREAYVGAPEMFVRLNDEDSGVRVSIGRQKRTWSELDESLGLGVWQPQLRWDYLNPIQQGLTGAFFDMKFDSLDVTLYGSPIFLPDQGPQFQVKEGRIESANRWFWKPQNRLRLGEDSSNLFYELETPKVDEIVMNPSLGGMMKVDPEGPLEVQLAYAYKPMNQFFIGYECSGCVDPLTGDGTAKIHPMVVNHHVFTAESRWVREEDRFLFSWTVDRPNDPKIPSDWGGSELRPVSIPGVGYERKFSLVQFPSTLQLFYFQELRGGRIGGGDLSSDVESSSDRYSFDDLLSASLSTKLRQLRSGYLELQTKYAYSFKEEGSWLSAQLTYQRQAFSAHLGFDVLGSNTDPLSSEAGLFSRYRSNDRVYGGIGFVF
ncbi:MAG: hypothetical protein CL676_12825 [Bdellovibrionaceae bacterium]|nr:hypothetical protein [Pseudobdellovibrionaceae bacterium]